MNKLTRRVGIAVVVLVILGVVGYFGAGYAVYAQLSPVTAECQGENLPVQIRDNTPENFWAVYDDRIEIDTASFSMPGYEDVEFSARGDDITISAWYIPTDSDSEEVIIFVHGIGSCRRNAEVLLPAGILYQAGFNILLIDMRNHGDSEVTDGRAAVGNREYQDVLGAYDWLLEQGFVSENIGLLGTSLGAATSINAFGEEEGISALWADSSFADIHDVLDAEMERNGYPSFFSDAGILVSRIMGIDLVEFSPLESIGKHNNRPIFITHGTADNRLSVDYAPQLLANAGDNAEIWIVEGTDHLEAVYAYTDEYEENLANFFVSALR